MNLANKITIFRILLIPFFVASILYYSPDKEFLRYVALSIFILAVVSDAADGYIARLMDQKTVLGTVIDPIADKLLLISAFICLSMVKSFPVGHRLPAWVTITIISRDIIIILGAIIIHMMTQNLNVQPSRLGKLTTFFQMLTIIYALLYFPYTFVIWNLAAFFTILSGIDYVRMGTKLLETHPKAM